MAWAASPVKCCTLLSLYLRVVACFFTTTFVNQESLWLQLTRSEDGTSTDCAYLGSFDVTDPVSDFPSACFSQAILLGADTFDGRPDGTKCFFKKCGAFADIRYNPDFGAANSYTRVINPWAQLTRAQDGQGTNCNYLGSHEVSDLGAFPLECQSQAALRLADTFDFRPENSKCYFKRCSDFADIQYTADFGAHDSFTILGGLKWKQLTWAADGQGSNCDYLGSFELQNLTDFPLACYSQALIRGADTFDFRPTNQKCYFKKCTAFADIQYTADFGAHDVHTLLDGGGLWTQLTIASDGQGTNCDYLGSHELANVSDFPMACYSQAALRAADTFDFRPTNNKCYFKRCGAFSDVLYTADFGAHDAYTVLTTGWTQLTRHEDGMGSNCEYLGSFEIPNMTGFPMSCYSQGAIRGADTFDFRPTNEKCYFKRCSDFADIQYTADFGAHDTYTMLFPRGNDEGWGPCELPDCLEMNLFYTADLRGRFTPVDSSGLPCDPEESDACFGGHARRFSFMTQMRQELADSAVFVDLGGSGFGPPFESHPDYPRGAPAAELMNYLDYDLCLFSQSDFLTSASQPADTQDLGHSFSQRTCPYLISNIELQPPFAGVMNTSERFKVVTLKNGTKVGFVSMFPNADNPGFTYGPSVVEVDPRSTLQQIQDGTFGAPFRLDVGELRAALAQLGGAYTALTDYLHDTYVMGTHVPNDVLQAAQLLKDSHPDVRAMVLLISKVYREDQIEWLKKYGPFDVILFADRAGDESFEVFTPEGSSRTRVIAKSETASGFGHLRVRFSQDGNVTNVEHFKDVALDSTVASEPTVQARLNELYNVTRQSRSQSFGTLTNPLVGAHRINEAPPSRRQCYYTDCAAGEYVGNSFLWKARSLGYKAMVSLSNLGGFRQVLPAGDISIVDCENTLSFRNTLGLYSISGNDLYLALESLMIIEDRGFAGSGMRASFYEPCWDFVNHDSYPIDMEEGPPGNASELDACVASGVTDINVRIINMEIYEVDFDSCTEQDLNRCPGQWVPLQKSTEYLMVTTTFLAGGFQGVAFPAELGEITIGTDATSLCEYVQAESPLEVEPWDAYWERGRVRYATSAEGWAAGNRNPSVAISESVIASLPLCPDGQYLDAATNKCTLCGPGTRSIEAPERDRCDDCPSGFFGATAGLSICTACAPGLYGESSRLTACVECNIARYSESGRADCASCPVGTFGNELGLGVCPPCPAGSFNALPGQSACVACEAGTYSTAGAFVCIECDPGDFINETGRSTCYECPRGTFSNVSGQSACHLCSEGKGTPDLWTTMQVDMINGVEEYNRISGVQDSSFCGCDKGTWFDAASQSCKICGEGLNCPGLGHVYLLAGFSADTAESVFECHSDEARCPGGAIGTCAEGRRSIACSECEDNMIPDDNGKCSKCEGGNYVPFVAAVLLVLFFLLALYIKVDQENASKQSRSTIVIAISAQQFLLALQMLSVLGNSQINWHEPMKSLFAVTRLLVVDIDIVNVNCVATLSALSKYMGRLLLVVGALAIVTLYHIIFVILFHGARFRSRMRSFLGVLGTVLMMFYISILGTILLSLECEEHPNGKWTVASYPSVFCWEGSDHAPMVIIACLALIFPVGFLVKCIHVVYVAPQRVNSLDVNFMLTYNFLFFRFSHEARWYAIFFLGRNALIACAPIITSIPWQIMVLQAIMLASTLCTTHFMPWRVWLANLIDVTTSVSMIFLMTLAAFQVEDGTGSFYAMLATAGVAVLFVVLLSTVVHGLYQKWLSYRKQFHFFLCHHKAHAGAMARLLKMQLSVSDKLKGKVFVDSDDLSHLDMLFDYVRCHTEVLTVLCTPEILHRPWCVGEITTAHLNGVKMLPVLYPQFQMPTDQWLQNVTQQFDFGCLTQNGLTQETVRSALEAFRALSNTLAMPTFLNLAALQQISREIIRGKAEGNASRPHVTSGGSQKMRDSASKVFMGVDQTNIEGTAAARILSKLVTPHCHQTPELIPLLLIDIDEDSNGRRPLPEESCIYAIVCTENCFAEGEFLLNLRESMEIKSWCVPTVAGEGFRFPTPAFYQELRANATAVFAQLGDEDKGQKVDELVEYVGSIFKAIAIVFMPHGSISLLQTQALEFFKKMYDTMGGVRDGSVIGGMVGTASSIKAASSRGIGSRSKDVGDQSPRSERGGNGGQRDSRIRSNGAGGGFGSVRSQDSASEVASPRTEEVNNLKEHLQSVQGLKVLPATSEEIELDKDELFAIVV